LPKEVVQGAIRLSLSWENSLEEVDHACEQIIRVIERLSR
jgi:cysteine sulfinate desulfinase/cysteine desulfurase-like protein